MLQGIAGGIRAGNMQGQRRQGPDASQQAQAFTQSLPTRPQSSQQPLQQPPQQGQPAPQYSIQPRPAPRPQPGPVQGTAGGAPPLTYLKQGVKVDPRNQTGFRNNPGFGYAGDAPAAPAFDFSGLFEASGAGGQATPTYDGFSMSPASQWSWF